MADRPPAALPLAVSGATAAIPSSSASRSSGASRPSSVNAAPNGPGAPPRSTLRREWALLAVAVALLLAIVLPPLVNLGRYQHRIIASMSRSLGRDVTMSAVTLRLLPMPALVLSDVIVNEAPGFGAEPALRAPSVTAQLRLTSLWRGRLEVSRVELSDASLNLVRDQADRWNIGSILLQASHVSNAPTGQRRAGPAPRFPYIEITDSRVNVKQGVEKLPYSLLNANVSMWLAEPDLWQLRLEGQPVRTDIELGLADTGTLRVEGSLHRATALGHMPLALHGDWTNAPLGQASRLLLGSDRGWRGDLHATADVAGDLDSLAIKTHVLIGNLHREEFTPAEPFAVDATCRGTYSRGIRALTDLSCRWPVGAGALLLSGNLAAGVRAQSARVSNQSSAPSSGLESTLALAVQQLPASFLLGAAGLARSDFAPAFRLEGALSGMLFYNEHAGNAPVYAGVLEAPHLRLEAAGLRDPLELRDARLAASTPTPAGASMLVLTAAPLDLGGMAPVQVNAQVTSQGFLLHAGGSAALARLEELGRAAHLLPAAMAWLAPQGTAEFDVTRSGGWQQGEAAAPATLDADGPVPSPERVSDGPAYATAAVTNGWLRLHNAKYAPRFLPEGVLLPTAQASFLPDAIAWNVPSAIFRQISLQLTATYPLDCAARPNCVTHVRAAIVALDGGEVASALLGTGRDAHLLDQIMNRLDSDSMRWPALEGTLHAETLSLGRLALRNADLGFSVANGRTSIQSLDAQALGGTLHAEGTITLAGGIPTYDLSTSLVRASASAAGLVLHENWGSGTVAFRAHLQLAGATAAELGSSAKGEFHAEWLRGALGTQTPLAHFALWTGDGLIQNQALTFTSAELTPSASATSLPIAGNISFDRSLSLQLGTAPSPAVPGSGIVRVTGTLPHPTE